MKTPEEITQLGTIDTLVLMLNAHAESSLQRSSRNQPYAEYVKAKAEELRGLLEGKDCEIQGLMLSWMSEIQPVAEYMFGADLHETKLGEHKDYKETIFDGVYARTRILSIDEIFGPTISLDVATNAHLLR